MREPHFLRPALRRPAALAALAAGLLACGDDAHPPGPLRERDRTERVVRPIDDAPGQALVFTRLRPDGWRKVELETPTRTFTFHDDPSLLMMDANGQGFGPRTVVCGLAVADPTPGTGIGILCAVADAAGFGPTRRIFTPTTASSAWLFDVCADGDRVELLFSEGTRPIDPDHPADAPACRSVAWTAAAGWADAPSDSATCRCAMRDGAPCADPCFLGAAHYKDGACDTSGLPSACDDNDPRTRDFCTGDPANLCYSVRPEDPALPPAP